MARWSKGKPFKRAGKTVMYIYRNGKKANKKLVSVRHKLAKGDIYFRLAKFGYKMGRRRFD